MHFGKLGFAEQKQQLCRVWLCFRCTLFSGRPSTFCLALHSEWMGISRQKMKGIKLITSFCYLFLKSTKNFVLLQKPLQGF